MMTFDVRPDGRAEFRIVATSKDLVIWEKSFKGRSLAQFDSNPSMTAVVEVAFTACRRQGRWDGTFSEFAETCEVEPIDTTAEKSPEGDEDGGQITGLDPTQPGP